MNGFIEHDKSSITEKLNFGKGNLMSFALVFIGLVVIFSYGMGNVAAANNTSSSNIYVDTHGNDTWNGQSATHQAGTLRGPKLTIKNATLIVSNGGTLNIANGQYKGSKNTEITINKNMNIKGQSETSTIINGSGTNWIFHINPGVTVTITNLTLTNGKSNNGSEIYNQGTLKADTCKFSNNNAATGSATYNEGSMAVISCTFTNNNGSWGGAIYNNGRMSVSRTLFSNNKPGSDGGAIYNVGAMAINACTFLNNSGVYDGDGGAIFNSGTLNVANSTFTNNHADAGSAIESQRGTLNVATCTFTNNESSDGGAIYNEQGSQSTVSYSKFINNSSSSGGAIVNGGTMRIVGCTFNSNHLNYDTIMVNNNGNGGAIENSGILTAIDSIFTNNQAYYGGAISNAGTTNLYFNRIIANTANYGKGIYNQDGTVDASLNWWGSNAGPLTSNYGAVNIQSWLILTVTSKPTTIGTNSKSTITVDLLHDNKGIYHNPTKGHIDNGIPITFTTTSGTIKSPISTINGIAQSTLKSGTKTGKATITVKLDNQTVKTAVTIK